MQYLPGWTVQCINPQCEARGHWLRANLTGPFGGDRCSNCGAPLSDTPTVRLAQGDGCPSNLRNSRSFGSEA